MTEDEKPAAPRETVGNPLGTILLVVGVLICLLATAESLGGLPFDMPRSWYLNRSLWIGLGVACLVAGFLIQRPPKGDERDTT